MREVRQALSEQAGPDTAAATSVSPHHAAGLQPCQHATDPDSFILGHRWLAGDLDWPATRVMQRDQAPRRVEHRRARGPGLSVSEVSDDSGVDIANRVAHEPEPLLLRARMLEDIGEIANLRG